MGKKRKTAVITCADDPHGWLASFLRQDEPHSVKAQRAVTALTGFEDIAGAQQGAGADRPFDHKAPDDAFRIDTKTQQHGVLDVKQEKPGKQFTAWARSGKRFIPVQLVLDGMTDSWYVVPGIPVKTLGLDPLAVAFDPAEPLAPFRVAGGCLDDLLDRTAFEVLRQSVQAALACLSQQKETLLKAIDKDYLVYLRSAAEDVAENPDLMNSIAANEDAMRSIAANEDAMRSIAANEDAMRSIAANEEAMRSIAANEDAMRSIAASPEAMRSIAASPEAMRSIAASPEAMRNLAANDAAMLELLGTEMFEVWKKKR